MGRLSRSGILFECKYLVRLYLISTRLMPLNVVGIVPCWGKLILFFLKYTGSGLCHAKSFQRDWVCSKIQSTTSIHPWQIYTLLVTYCLFSPGVSEGWVMCFVSYSIFLQKHCIPPSSCGTGFTQRPPCLNHPRILLVGCWA